eukprot:6633390-Prymnesium_polylepis.1
MRSIAAAAATPSRPFCSKIQIRCLESFDSKSTHCSNVGCSLRCAVALSCRPAIAHCLQARVPGGSRLNLPKHSMCR